jgi:hypothetical protein
LGIGLLQSSEESESVPSFVSHSFN